MKLNPDCVRDILLSTEDNTGYNEYLVYPGELDKCPLLQKYIDDEIKYHIFQCVKSGLLEARRQDLAGNIEIQDLTPKGHEFLANIRSDNVWNKTKNVALKMGSFSVSTLTNIATGVITELIKQQFAP